MPKLTAKQSRFVEEYLIDLNATQAAIRAGYSANGAEVQGSKLLRIAKVAQEIASAQEARSQRTQIDADWVLDTIQGTIKACQELDKPDSSNILKGCELLGRHLKMFTDKAELTGKDGAPLSPPELTVVINGKPKQQTT